MAQFEFTLTNKGADLLSKVVAGQLLTFTKCAIGDGELPVGVELHDLSALVAWKKDISITNVAYKGIGKAVIRMTVTNQAFTADFTFREIGIYAQDPSVGEILYAVANAGANADLIPAYGGNEIVEMVYDLIAIVGTDVVVQAVIDNSIIYATAQDLLDHIDDPMAHGGHNLWQSAKVYEVGDVCYSPRAASYKRFECVVAGTSGAVEPTWPVVGQMVMDNTVQWIVDDVRDGTPVGRGIYEDRATPRAGYIKRNGALLNRSEFPRLWRYAQDSGLIVSEAEWSAGMSGCFTTGIGSTTFRIPDGRGEFDRGWDDGRGVDQSRVLGGRQNYAIQSHTHIFDIPKGGGGGGQNVQTGPFEYLYITNLQTKATGGVETRPRNVARLAVIKY